MQKSNTQEPQRPPQTIQKKQGQERAMKPEPDFYRPKLDKKLNRKVAIITGGDSGIGRAVAVAYAQEGANMVLVFKEDQIEADRTKKIAEELGSEVLLLKKDISKKGNCKNIIERTIKHFGSLHILVNNAGVHFPEKKLSDINEKNLRLTFETNFFGSFYLIQAAEKYLKRNSCIINTTSVTAYRGSGGLIDYASTKGAIVSLTRSLAAYFAPKNIRVNAVAPGPVWTPLIPTSFSAKKVSQFGSDVPLGRAGEPSEIAPCFVFLACDDSSYITGQVLHPNGGEIVNG